MRGAKAATTYGHFSAATGTKEIGAASAPRHVGVGRSDMASGLHHPILRAELENRITENECIGFG
jgi:hypothetical protein